VAGEYLISWAVVHDAFVAHAEELLSDWAPTMVLGIDETRRGRAKMQPRPRSPAGGCGRIGSRQTSST
jgi:hypothetical protein